MKKIDIAIIGKSGHAARLIDILNKKSGVNLKCIYYPGNVSKDSSKITNEFDKILCCNAVVIASPTYTHFKYLNKLKDYKGYILVEKPAVSFQPQSKKLLSISKSRKKKIKVNYNFIYSKTAKLLTKLTRDKSIGRVISLDVWTSHGLAFKNQYKGSWRNDIKYSYGVLELVGAHFINLAINIFGPIEKANIYENCYASKSKQSTPDTVKLILQMKNGIMVNLYHSYAGPYFNKIMLIGTNGYFDYDGKVAKIYSPRECYDLEGRFKSPQLKKTIQLDYSNIWKNSLGNAVAEFIKVVKKGGFFQIKDFKIALASMEPIYQARKDKFNDKSNSV